MPPSTRTMAAISCTVPVAAGAAVVCFASSFMFYRWQARRESNPQPAVLETAALPIELLACGYSGEGLAPHFQTGSAKPDPIRECVFLFANYFRILATTPAPTVRPP